MISDRIPLGGFQGRPPLRLWEKNLAYHHGLYLPQTTNDTRTPDEIRAAAALYSEKLRHDSPNDACNHLQAEEFRCLQAHQYESKPESAASNCVKWFTEWTQCKW
eukprot:Selendium_serpulae@DN6199_c0_g1_i2.p1